MAGTTTHCSSWVKEEACSVEIEIWRIIDIILESDVEEDEKTVNAVLKISSSSCSGRTQK